MKNIYRWDNLTRPELEQLAREDAIVIIHVGAIEQHGPHLPVGTDAILGRDTAEAVAERLSTQYGKRAIVTPTMAVANSTHHMSFAGSMTLSPITFLTVLTEICECVAAHGFRKLYILNTHGGNRHPIQVALIMINEKLGFHVYTSQHVSGSEQEVYDILETQNGMAHGGEMETALMLYLHPELVDPMYTHIKGGNLEKTVPGGIENSHASTFERMEELTENGSIGNAYAGTAEKGKAMFEAMVTAVSRLIYEAFYGKAEG